MTHAIDLLAPAEFQAKINQCIHCGMCLEACPTYPVFGTEMDSPRGRIALMRAVAEDRIGADDPAFAEHIDRCLGCRACETACPSGVQYGALFEQAHVLLARNRTQSTAEKLVAWIGLRQMLPHVDRLRILARLIWLYQALGLQRLVRLLPLPPTLRAMEAISPPIKPQYRDYRVDAPAIGARRGRVAFLHGCVQEAFLAPVNHASIRVLQRNGYDVVFPAAQTCCGAAQVHAGDSELARDLARRNIDACLAENVDAIISNAGGCGMALKEYAHLLHDDPRYADRAREFVASVQDINEFLADHLHVPPQGAVRATATYVDSCHLRHGQRIVQQPRELLRGIAGLRLVELQHPDQCCGSAGIYNIVQPRSAGQILDAKISDVATTGANIVVVSNTGCHMQIIAGVREAGIPARVLHVVEVLDQAYQAQEQAL